MEMKNILAIAIALLLLCLPTLLVVAKPSQTVIGIDALRFEENGSDSYRAVFDSISAPMLVGFENLVICGLKSVAYLGPNGIPFCPHPIIYMDRWKRVASPSGDPANRFMKDANNGGQIIVTDIVLLDVPENLFYCIYPDKSSPLCELFPTNSNIKIGDQFWACQQPHNWALNGRGPDTVVDCDESGLGATTRYGKLIVDNISSGVAYLRFTVRYKMGGYGGYDPTYILKKIPPEKKKAKTFKSKKK